MANYKQSEITGSSWVRANRVALENPLNGQSMITFYEETAIALGDGKIIQQPNGTCQEYFAQNNANDSFDLIHPETGGVIGTSTYQDVYVMMASLYMHVAKKRDDQMILPTPAPV